MNKDEEKIDGRQSYNQSNGWFNEWSHEANKSLEHGSGLHGKFDQGYENPLPKINKSRGHFGVLSILQNHLYFMEP